MRRTFIAVDIKPSPVLIQAINEIKKILAGEKIKWTDTGNMHITLAFLGDTDEDLIDKIAGGLPLIAKGAEQPYCSVAGLGVFPGINNPRVLWAGIKNHEHLASLQLKVSGFLHTLYIITEDRDFKPHLTLGRIKSLRNRAKLHELLNKYRDKEFQTSIIKELIYYESILRPEGPVYKPITTVKL